MSEHLRYDRHIRMPEIGEKGQAKLSKASVLVIGAGGLGCPILQYLAAAGIGEIGIVDNDVVSISNLQRQILFSSQDVGRKKVIVAKEKLELLNPSIKIRTFDQRLSTENVLSIVEEFELIVDGTDNFASRYLINDACVILDKTLIFGSIYKFEGQVSVFNYKKGPTYRCIYPDPPMPGEMPACSEVGVLGVLPGMIGTFMCNEVLKIILSLGEVLSGKLLSIDALSLSMNQFSISVVEKNHLIRQLEKSYESFCGLINLSNESISGNSLKEMLQSKEEVLLIDVRTEQEFDQLSLDESINIPLDDLENRISEISEIQNIVFICHSGQRSTQALEICKEKLPSFKLFQLSGGISAYPW